MTGFIFDSGGPVIQDKWILSSAVQKLIRRGCTEQACETALRLETISPGYLRRRLPVIGYEDIGVADSESVLAVVRLCSTKSAWTDAAATIKAAVTALAGAAKSRTACEAACLCTVDPGVLAAREACGALSGSQLLATATERQVPWERRAAALEVLGLRLGQLRQESRARLDQVADAFQMPGAARALWRDRTRDLAPMAVMIPLAFEALAEPTQSVDSRGLCGSDRLVRGTPLFALDMYSRAGRCALSAYARSSPEIRRFRSSCRDPANLGKAVAMAVFHLDSCRLVRHLVTDASERLRERIETLELARLGVAADERPQLYAAITGEVELLNAAREKVLRGLP